MKNKARNQSDAPRAKKFTSKAKNRSFQSHEDDEALIWGLHAVSAVLKNPARKVKSAVFSRNAAQRLDMNPDALPGFARLAEPKDIDQMLPEGAVHQGAMLKADFLEPISIEEAAEGSGPIVILDQVTDPMNVGAILRSAAAFGVTAAVMQTRKAPPLAGVLAKAAVGAVDTVYEVRVVNISRAVESLIDAGWRVVGLAGDADAELEAAVQTDEPLAIVMGAEGSGLRPGVAKSCSMLARIPISSEMESLNVSNAAAIAFYAAARQNQRS